MSFIATPIGAAITAVVLGIGLLTKAISGNQNSADSFGKAWAGVGNILGFISGLLTKLGQALIDVAAKPKQALSDLVDFLEQNVMNRFKSFGVIMESLGKFMSGDFSAGAKQLTDGMIQLTTGVENATDKMLAFGNSMGDAYNAGAQLKEMQIELEKQQISSITTLQQLQDEESKLSLIADDNTKSLKQREQASKDLTKVQSEMSSIRVGLLKQEYEAEKARVDLETKNNGSLSRENEKALAEKKAALMQGETDQTNLVLEGEKKRREIKKDALNRELDFLIDGFDSIKTFNEKIINDDKATTEQRRKGLEDLTKASEANFQKQIDTVNEFYNLKINGNELLEISDTKLLNSTISNFNVADDISGRILEIIKERRMQMSDLTDSNIALSQKEAENAIANLDVTLRQYKANNQSKLDNATEFSEQLYSDEKNRLDKISEIQKSQIQLSKESKLITEQEANTQLLELKTQLENDKLSLDLEFEQKKIEEAQYQFGLNQELLSQSLMGEFDAKTNALLAQEQQEIEFANKTILKEESRQKALENIRKKYDKAEKAIKLAKFQAELALAGDFAKNIATIAGENTKVGKAASVAATTISTIQGGVAAFTGMTSSIPGPVGIGLGIAAAAAALASGYASVKKILSVQSGLPGDGGSASGGGGEGATVPSISAVAPTLAPSVNPSLGQGIVSRQVEDNSSATRQKAFSNALIENPLRPTLVTDDVTVSQSNNALKNKTSSI